MPDHISTALPQVPVRKSSYCTFITPYKQLRCGTANIYDYTVSGYAVPEKVIAYLRAGTPSLTRGGTYPHPFATHKVICSPTLLTDGKYVWDNHTWMYVLKYGLVLPAEFIDYVMSTAGDEFIGKAIDQSDLWCDIVKSIKKKQGYRSFLPSTEDLSKMENF